MALVINTAPVNAISTYSDLLAEIRDLTDNASYSEDAIGRAIAKAEAMFSRELRCEDMEISTALTVTAATATLPSDLRELRAVIWVGDSEYALSPMSLRGLADTYGGESASYPKAYAVEGLTLRFGPVASGTVRIVYHARLTPLTTESPENWLLRYAPDLYVAGVMFYISQRERDSEGVTFWQSQALGLMNSVQNESNRFTYQTMHPQGMTQVPGART